MNVVSTELQAADDIRTISSIARSTPLKAFLDDPARRRDFGQSAGPSLCRASRRRLTWSSTIFRSSRRLRSSEYRRACRRRDQPVHQPRQSNPERRTSNR